MRFNMFKLTFPLYTYTKIAWSSTNASLLLHIYFSICKNFLVKIFFKDFNVLQLQLQLKWFSGNRKLKRCKTAFFHNINCQIINNINKMLKYRQTLAYTNIIGTKAEFNIFIYFEMAAETWPAIVSHSLLSDAHFLWET